MAKTRQQRKAEKRARERRAVDPARERDAEAQARTQVPRSGEVAEAEAQIAQLEQEAIPEAAPVEAKPARQKPKPRPKEKERKAAAPAPRKGAPPAERQRGRVISFLSSCWAELKRVQWPDRPTVLQATAVVLVFVAIAAAYLGALDAVFGKLVKAVL